MPETAKSQQAFRTIGELADELGVPQHILRYWETRFSQLKPLQRAGNRRYYRPADVALARRIHHLLERDGYTIRGVQQLLGSRAIRERSAHWLRRRRRRERRIHRRLLSRPAAAWRPGAQPRTQGVLPRQHG